MKIKRQIVLNSFGSAMLIAAVGLFSAVSMLRISSTLRAIEVTESARFREAGQSERAAGRETVRGGSVDIELAAREQMLGGLQVAQNRIITSARLFIAAAALAVILSLALGSLVGMPLATRLARLRDGAVDIGKGRGQGPIGIDAGDEIGEVAAAFNEMAETVRVARDKAWENDWKFREMAKSIREVYWVTNPTCSEVSYVSPAYEAVWGRSGETLRSHPLSFADAIVPEDRSRVLDAVRRMENFDEEYRIVRPDGVTRRIRARGHAVRNQIGKVLRIITVCSDVTDQRTAEDSLRGANAALRRLSEPPKGRPEQAKARPV